MTSRQLWMLGVLGICATVAGCSSGGKGAPKSYPVSGEVTYQGNPVDGADVMFTPATESPDSRPASGKTDAQGKFTLKTYFSPTQELDGAVAGDYKVTVIKKETGGVSQEEMKKLMMSGQPVPIPKDQLPAKYANPNQSGLQRKVSDSEKNEFKIELTD